MVLKNILGLECETSQKQGTGFFLKDVGVVTCSHVLGQNSKMILPGNPSNKYDVTVVSKNDDIDLAILNIESYESPTNFTQSVSAELSQMDHLLISGFPNYRVGDSGLVIPGIVTGYRTILAIRRLLTNAPIVAGNSGGPVFNKSSEVIGIAVTGSDDFNTASDTENHGIIPIEALKYL